MTPQEILSRIEQCKLRQAKLDGQREEAASHLKSVISELSSKFGVSSLEEAEQLVESLTKKVHGMTEELSSLLEELGG